VTYLANALTPDNVLSSVRVNSKKHLFHILSNQLARTSIFLQAEDIYAAISEREQVETTGFERGVAFPHARLNLLKRPVCAFARLESQIAWDSHDGLPVDLVLMLLSPSDNPQSHLKLFAEVARLFSDQSLCKQLRGTDNADSIYAILTQSPDGISRQLRAG